MCKPEERDTIGTNPSTRLFIVVVLVSRKGNFKTGVLIENGVFPRKLLHRLCWEKNKRGYLNLSTFDGDSALKSLPSGLIGGFTTGHQCAIFIGNKS